MKEASSKEILKRAPLKYLRLYVGNSAYMHEYKTDIFEWSRLWLGGTQG